MNYENIPQELKVLKQWVLMKLIQKPGEKKPSKVPFQTNGKPALPADKKDGTKASTTWNTFDEVLKRYTKGGCDGIGFVFSKDNPYCGIDFDKCVQDGNISDDVQKWIDTFDSYTEISTSGTGAHIIIKGKKPSMRCKNTQLGYEVYGSERYFVMTGDLLKNKGVVNDRQLQLNEFCNTIFKKDAAEQIPIQQNDISLDDSEIIEKASRAKNGSLFNDLYSGNWKGLYESQSDADLTLCNLIAFYTKDFNQIDNIFCWSGLYREKWNRPDYKRSTIEKAIRDSGTYAGTIQKDSAKQDFSEPLKNNTTKPETKNSKEPLKITTVSDYMNSEDGYEKELIKNRDQQKIYTGFEKLDKELGGHLYAGLYTIGSISSLGKSSLIAQIADNIAGQEIDVLFFALEMGKCEMLSRSLLRNFVNSNPKENYGYNIGHVMYGTAGQKIMPITNAYKANEGKHLYMIEGNFDVNVFTIRETVKQHVESTGRLPVVIIDYLQVLKPVDARMTDKAATDLSVIELKRISRDYNIPVIAVSSFNRGNYSTPVSYESFKESGSIEFTSDCVMGIQLQVVNELDHGKGKDIANKQKINEAKNKTPRELELVILKNRRGKAWAKIPYEFHPSFYYFDEV